MADWVGSKWAVLVLDAVGEPDTLTYDSDLGKCWDVDAVSIGENGWLTIELVHPPSETRRLVMYPPHRVISVEKLHVPWLDLF